MLTVIHECNDKWVRAESCKDNKYTLPTSPSIMDWKLRGIASMTSCTNSETFASVKRILFSAQYGYAHFAIF